MTDPSLSVGEDGLAGRVGVMSDVCYFVGILPADGGQAGGGGAGNAEQEGPSETSHALHHQDRTLHTRSSSVRTSSWSWLYQ